MSFRGAVVSLHAAPRRGAAAAEVPQARLVPGQGLEGDRHFGNAAPDRPLTLIEIEALEALGRPTEPVQVIPVGAAGRYHVSSGKTKLSVQAVPA
jgi:hypothetical protein